MAEGAANWNLQIWVSLSALQGSNWFQSPLELHLIPFFFSFFLVSYPDCIDSESRCPFDWLCFLLEIQVTSITGRFLPHSIFLLFHNKQMLAMQYLNVFICLIFLLKQFCVDFFRKQFPGTLILTYLQWSLDPTFLARSVNSSDLIFISLCQLLYISLRFSGENFIFYQDQS